MFMNTSSPDARKPTLKRANYFYIPTVADDQGNLTVYVFVKLKTSREQAGLESRCETVNNLEGGMVFSAKRLE